jgi:ATP synthase assembly factor FMC1, mitochondrial
MKIVSATEYNLLACLRLHYSCGTWKSSCPSVKPPRGGVFADLEISHPQNPNVNNIQLPTSKGSTRRTKEMATQPATLRSLYRALLRELPPRPLLSSARSSTHIRLRNQLAPTSQADSPTSTSTSTPTNWNTEAAVAEAEEMVAYLRAQRTYATLLERYNPGMGMDEEERVRLTARRVGMDLPVEFEEKKE